MANCAIDNDIVFDGASPLLPVTDAALIATETDGAVLAVRHGKVTRDQVRHAVERLAHVDADLVGTVLSMAPTRGRQSRYGYGYGYAYGYGPEATGKRSKSRFGKGNGDHR